ncbi:sialoadhesin-like isoform X2 [Ctenopharyngodon idella]|uniref:sialoadhesin-like isoform X2 n=1 Tax=Ctenopharyngodon idella TaxID=7959 RepID=UPI002231C309|nr:sialoadhesin-like isoform X2 [Ctenopharyngodon idella]
MSVFQIMSFFIIIISSVFLHTHSADDIYSAVMPQTVTALTGSCVQIPCTFNISNFEDKLNTIIGIWLKNKSQFEKDSLIVSNISKNIIRGFSDIQITGNLSEGNCTTVFYNLMKNHSDLYYFRLEMEPDVFKATFNPNQPDSRKTVKITVIDSPQPPELKPNCSRYVMENTTVNLICSAEAPCPKQPPTISWSNNPESANITTQLQEKPDKTQSVFSNMTFKASYMDHRRNISCIATYPRNTSNYSTVETTVMLQVLFPPKETHITINPSASVSVGTNVTLTCRSKASPSNDMNYTWYKRGQETPIAWGKRNSFIVTNNKTGFYFCTAQNKHGNQSSAYIQLTVEDISQDMGQDGHSMLIIGCVGGIVAALMLSALGFCTRTRTKTHRGDNVGEKYSLNQDEIIDRNSTYATVTMTNQDNKISDDYSMCERKTKTDHDKVKVSTNEDDNEKGSDVVYAQVHVLQNKTKAISVVPEVIYAQVT